MSRTINDGLKSGATMGFYITEIFKSWGKDFTICEMCNKSIKGKHILHHTKYEDCTIYDIRIACKSCDQKAENKNLD